MNREEAIEVYNGLINTKIKEAFEFFAPELRKINEEEIRKDIIGGLMWQRDNLKSEGPHDNNLILPGFCLTVGKHLSYLERQKEQPISAEEVLARAGLKPYKDGNQWCILAGDNIQEGICGFGDTIEDALYEFLKEVLDLQKEQKSIPIPPPCWESAIQEPKPELVQQPPITYTYKSNASRDERLKAALLALLNSDLLKVKEGGYFTKQDLIEWVERIPTDKPAEWSVEDKLTVDSAIFWLKRRLLSEKAEDISTYSCPLSMRKTIERLESFRPSWKPSEEQMEAFRIYLYHPQYIDNSEDIKIKLVESLYNDLKKLM